MNDYTVSKIGSEYVGQLRRLRAQCGPDETVTEWGEGMTPVSTSPLAIPAHSKLGRFYAYEPE